MREINIYPVAVNSDIVNNISSLIKDEPHINLASYSENIKSLTENFGKGSASKKYLNVFFIDDLSFDKSQIINFLKSTAPSSIYNKNRDKRLIYTDSLNGNYIKNIISTNVCCILHKKETRLSLPHHLVKDSTKQSRYYKNNFFKAGKEKLIETLKLVEQGSICYDGIINSFLVKRRLWARGFDEFTLNPQKSEEPNNMNLRRGTKYNNKEVISDILKLTGREKEVLRFIARGKQNKEIAEILHISVSTVETHKENILKRLNFRTTTELIFFAVHNEALIEKL